jgi:hypothetical protein
MKLTPQDLVDITEHFRTSNYDPHKPPTPEQQAVKDTLRRELDAQFAPPIDVPEPAMRFYDMVNLFHIILIGVFLLYAGVFIGGAIAYLLR